MAKQTFTTGQVLTAAQMTSLQQTAMLGGDASAKVASYVLVAADAGTAISMSNASATTITVNTGLFAAGDIVTIVNLGAGVCTITAGTATVATSGSLALAQNQGGVLRFTSASAAIFFQFATPASGDIEGVTAGTGISGGGTSGTVTITNSMATEITAKGDLIVGTGNATFDNLAAGSNGDTIVADSSASTGLRWQENYAAGKNQCINGAFNVWQRGTSFAGNVYTADRWTTQTDKTLTVSQQAFTAGTAPVAGYESAFFLRQAYSAGGSYGALQTKLEDVRLFAGQTITLSYWAKADATYSNTPSVSQNFGSGGSASVGTNGTTHNITTTWTRYSSVITVPSISGKTIGTSSFFMLQPILIESAGARTIDIWGVQVEDGSVATAFQTATGTLAGELAACQRYFQLFGGNNLFEYFGIGAALSATESNFVMPWFVPMRTAPTATFTTASNYRVTQGTSANTATVVQGDILTKNNAAMQFQVASGLTAGNATRCLANNTLSATISVSAEL